MPERGAKAQYYDSAAARFRKRYSFPYDETLNPFTLAGSLGIKVIEPNDISGISKQDLGNISSIGADWSGLSFSLPDNRIIVILNPFHTEERKNITLMEEIYHFHCGHKPKVKVRLSGSPEIDFRSYTQNDETEAYSIAAAVLVPFKALKLLVSKHKNIEEMALHFKVSPELIEYRLKITRLLSLFKPMQEARKFLESS